MRKPLYTVSRCRAQTGDLYGPTHGSMDAVKTTCGLDLRYTNTWWICTNAFDAMPTCKKCLKIHDDEGEKCTQ